MPHGWTLFETETTKDPNEGEAGEETEVSIYDYLLAQSLYVPVGKAFLKLSMSSITHLNSFEPIYNVSLLLVEEGTLTTMNSGLRFCCWRRPICLRIGSSIATIPPGRTRHLTYITHLRRIQFIPREPS